MTIELDPAADEFPTDDQRWDLDVIFDGGADSEEFEEYFERTQKEGDAFASAVAEIAPLAEAKAPDGPVIDAWVELIRRRQSLTDRLREAMGFARCLSAAHARDVDAMALPGRVNELQSRLETVNADLIGKLQGVDDKTFDWLVERDELEGLGLYLRELRRDAQKSMDARLESLAASLNRDGLHAWSDLYTKVTGALNVEVDSDDSDEVEQLSVGQAKNLLSKSDRDLRRSAYEGLQEAWASKAPILSSILNSIVGAKETMIERRDLELLEDPLDINRIEKDTLEAMLETADAMRPVLQEFLDLKRQALGVDDFHWYDLGAPVGSSSDETIPYEEAQEFIVEQIDDFSQEMGQFYRYALVNQWVEAEDRSGKAQGGFCMPFSDSGQVRVFMTYSGSMTNILTLAHELGHAYHGWLLKDLSAGARKMPMTLAESASTLSEKLVESAALEQAEPDEELRLLDGRLSRALTFLVDIPARFRLERAMHEMRREGRLSAAGLSETTREIFGEAYGDTLASLDQFFWASKLHFYITRTPFYNFPYLFGYLFSKALYDRACEQGDAFAGVVDDLLSETGKLTAEELAEKYLDEDITRPDFWMGAAKSLEGDVERYRSLVE